MLDRSDKSESLFERLARKLMHDVYAEFTACVWLDEAGRILDLYQFDTLYCTPKYSAPKSAQACVLISNHPDGYMEPLNHDVKNCILLKEQHPSVLCRLLIYAEDIGIREIREI